MISSLFDTRVTVSRSLATPDGQGGFDRAPSIVASVLGRVRPLSAREAVLGGFGATTRAVRVYLPGEVEVLEKDELRVAGSALVYEVVAVARRAEPGAPEHHVEVDAEERH